MKMDLKRYLLWYLEDGIKHIDMRREISKGE